MTLRIACMVALFSACGGGGEPAVTASWSNTAKCEHMCATYCSVRHSCDGTASDVCRMRLDADNGGTCEQRAGLFDEISQEQVEACMEAVENMGCAAFKHMLDTGDGVPEPCRGILS